MLAAFCCLSSEPTHSSVSSGALKKPMRFAHHILLILRPLAFLRVLCVPLFSSRSPLGGLLRLGGFETQPYANTGNAENAENAENAWGVFSKISVSPINAPQPPAPLFLSRFSRSRLIRLAHQRQNRLAVALELAHADAFHVAQLRHAVRAIVGDRA